MNFTPKIPLQAGGPQSAFQLEGHSLSSHNHAESDNFNFPSTSHLAHADAFIVPDAHLLFSGDYTRSGRDLIISDDLHRFVLPNYFAGEKRPMLVSPEGAAIDQTFVEALTGHLTYAQAGAGVPAAKVVGHVVKMTGSASIVRNGVAIVVNTGDTLYQNDVVQTGSNSTLGLVLDDGTAFNLSANARFMLNELNYDPNSTSNSSLMTLVQGAASFVAGQIAPTGDMKVATPVSLVGIRGTAVILDISSTDGTVSVSVVDQQDQQVHSVEVFRCVQSPQGVCSAGDLIATVTSNGPSLTLTPAGPNVITQEISKSPNQVTQEFDSFQQVLNTYDTGKQQFPNLPQHTENTNPNNNDTGSTKTAAGSPPLQPSTPPSTTVFTDASHATAGSNGESNPLVGTAIVPVSAVVNVSPTSLTQSTETTQAFIINAVAPPLEPLAIANPGGPTNQVAQTISGTVDPSYAGTAVTILDTYNGVTTPLGTTTVGSGGAWTTSVTLSGTGTHSIVAQDTAANSTSAPVVFTLATAAPTMTITSPGGPTNAATQTITGMVSADVTAPGSTVTLFDNGGTTPIGSGIVQADGTWSIPNVTLAPGVNSLVAKDTDLAGNTGSSTAVVYTLSTTGPTVAIGSAGGPTNVATQTITGTVSADVTAPGSTVTLFDNGGTTPIGSAIVQADGSWTITNVTLAPGVNSLVAKDIDQAGNTGTSAAVVYTLSTTAPTVTIAPVDGTNVINAANAAGGVALGGSISGIAANSTFNVTVTDGASIKTYAATVNGTGTAWSATIPAGDATVLANGTATIAAQVSDAFGNPASFSQNVTVAESGPAIAINPVDGTNVINAANAAGGVALGGSISGIAANSTFNVTVTDGASIKTYAATVNGTGTAWSATIPAGDATVLANGTATIAAQVSDAFGNPASFSQNVTVAESGPAIAINPVDGTNVINAANAAGGVALGGSISGIAANSTFNVTVTDGASIKTYAATVNGTGTAWSATIPAGDATVLANGTATIAAQVSDAFGNPASFSQNVTVAESGPAIAINPVDGTNVINAANAAGGVALGGSISGIAANSTFNVTVTDGASIKTYAATVNGTGTAWSATIPAGDATVLANGTATIAAQVSDAFGNPASFSQNVTVAESGPAIAINPVDGTNVINAANAAGGVALGGSISGIAANSTFNVTVTDGASIKTYAATVNGTGTAWSATIPAGDATVLANGTATIAAQVSDAFGNPASFSQNVTVAESGPAIAINPVDGTNVINAANAAGGVALGGSISGIAANSTFNVTVTDGASIKTYAATVNGTGTAWSATIPAGDATVLANGTATIAAQVSDAFGNPASFSQNVTVAESGPAIAINPVDGTNVINAANAAGGVALGGSISGIAANSTFNVTVTDGASIKTYAATVNGTGTAWSATIPAGDATVLANGTATIAAQVSDAFGNPASFSQNVTVAETLPTVTISNAGGSSNQFSQTISGTVDIADAGATVRIYDNSGSTPIATAVVQSDGTWSNLVTMAPGTNSLTAKVTDVAGNTGTSNTVVFTLPTITVQWIGSSGGSWGIGTNWSTGNPPGSADDVLIGLDNVTFSAGSSVIDGLYSAVGSKLTVSGGTFTINNTSNSSNLQGSLALSGGTLSANGQMSIASFTQSGSDTLTGTGTVAVTSTATFSGGTYILESGSGTTDLQVGATGTLSAGVLALDGGRKLQNDGTFNWTGGSIAMGTNPFGTSAGGSTITNSAGAIFNDNVASSISTNAGTNLFSNAGTFATNFSGTTTIAASFNNTGTVQIGAGSTLSLNNGGSSTAGSFTGAGTIQFGGGSNSVGSSISTTNATFSGGTTALTGQYNVTGITTVNGGTANFTGTLTNLGNTLNISSGTLNLNGFTPTVSILIETGSDTLTGTGTVAVTSTATFSGGTYILESGSGTTDLQVGATGTLSAGVLALDGGRKLQNDGTFNWTGGSIAMGTNPFGTSAGGSTITNSAGAIFNDNVASSISTNAGTNLFSNAGTFATNFSTGTTNVGVTFNNSGSVQVAAGGTLSINSGGSSAAGSFSGAGTLQFTNGYTFNAASSISTTNVIFSGGTIALSGTYTAPNTTLSGGTLNTGSNPITFGKYTQSGSDTLTGTGTVAVTSTATFAGGTYILESGSGTTDLQVGATGTLSAGVLALDGGRKLQNDGTFNWTGGSIAMGTNPFGTSAGGSTITNSAGAIFNDNVASSISTNAGTNLFSNAGTFATNFSGTTTIAASFNNTGTVQIGAGSTLSLNNGGALPLVPSRALVLFSSAAAATVSARAFRRPMPHLAAARRPSPVNTM